MKSYQSFYMIIFAMIGIELLGVLLILSEPPALFIILNLLVFPIIILVLFYRLEVSIDETTLNIKFGIGLIHKTIKLSDIIAVKPVTNSALTGWGLRLGLGYTMYNVSGYEAIELTLRNRKRTIRIGVDQEHKILPYLLRATVVS